MVAHDGTPHTESVVVLILTTVGAYEPLPQTPTSETLAFYVTGALENGTFAYLYLNSAVRLKRMGVPPKAAKQPKFPPTVKLR